jgi:trimeric autotransporter adhesin
MNSSIQIKRAIPTFLLASALVLSCSALSPRLLAQSPTNTSLGVGSLQGHSTGIQQTAIGYRTLYNQPSGDENTAIGALALQQDTAGHNNTAVGGEALINNTRGSENIALGRGAGFDQDLGNNNIYIGDIGVAGENNVIAVGRTPASGLNYEATYVGGIHDAVVSDRIVYVQSDGRLGTLASSRRYKEDIKPMDKSSEGLFALKPVTFRYKQEFDLSHKLSFGLIAEEVAKVSADLVSNDKDGKPQTVRYEAINAMLLNEFLKEHKTVQELKKEIAALTATVNEQAAQIQKVSARLDVNKAVPQMVSYEQ